MADISKSLKVAKTLNIKVKLTDDLKLDSKGLNTEFDPSLYISRGSWPGYGKTIYINPKVATNYTVLHEIGHVLNGLMCCREHCEFAAHGAAIALGKIHNINLGIYAKYQVDCYAGRSSRKACASIDLHKQGFDGYQELSILQRTKGKVTRILDNATFMIDNKGRPIVLKGINPIPNGDPHFLKEKKKLEKLIKNKTIFYKWEETDIYGRKVCQVYLFDINKPLSSININKEIKKCTK